MGILCLGLYDPLTNCLTCLKGAYNDTSAGKCVACVVGCAICSAPSCSTC